MIKIICPHCKQKLEFVSKLPKMLCYKCDKIIDFILKYRDIMPKKLKFKQIACSPCGDGEDNLYGLTEEGDVYYITPKGWIPMNMEEYNVNQK
jgi:hypothetical protein